MLPQKHIQENKINVMFPTGEVEGVLFGFPFHNASAPGCSIRQVSKWLANPLRAGLVPLTCLCLGPSPSFPLPPNTSRASNRHCALSQRQKTGAFWVGTERLITTYELAESNTRLRLRMPGTPNSVSQALRRAMRPPSGKLGRKRKTTLLTSDRVDWPSKVEH